MTGEMTMNRFRTLVIFAVAFIACGVQAQSFVLDLPLKSQRASVSQRIGLTTVEIRYHRPLVNGRKIWGDVVPYGKVWRTGANTIPTITFSDPVTIEGKPLDRGTYGLHTIPSPDEWTIIFSKNSTSWGSFTYDQSEDALRVTVKPQPGDMHNALTFDFDDLQARSAVVALKWEKLAVPFRVEVDVPHLTDASLREQLRGQKAYMWNSWNDAATYLLGQKLALDDALTYANKSIEQEDRFDNELTKSKVLSALNRETEAAAAQHRAIEVGNPSQVNAFAVALLKSKKNDDAFAAFRDNAKLHPSEWVTHEGLARMYSAQRKFDDATKELRLAIAAAPEDAKANLTSLAKKVAAREDIND
jgi:hypothetical protein